MGVFPSASAWATRPASLPHARGGVSNQAACFVFFNRSSPRPWWCFPYVHSVAIPRWVFPTPVGVFPRPHRSRRPPAGLPHARGGVSIDEMLDWLQTKSSPRPWGCFHLRCSFRPRCQVFPTPVGVFPLSKLTPPSWWSLPHARGGVSKCVAQFIPYRWSSPRPWGCFLPNDLLPGAVPVFPTPVGVFPSERHQGRAGRCLPHARGGVSATRSMHSSAKRSSPRPWGCFWSA